MTEFASALLHRARPRERGVRSGHRPCGGKTRRRGDRLRRALRRNRRDGRCGGGRRFGAPWLDRCRLAAGRASGDCSARLQLGRCPRRLGIHRGLRGRRGIRRPAPATRRRGRLPRRGARRPAQRSHIRRLRRSDARPGASDATVPIVAYAVLSLTVVRLLPVGIAMLGTRRDARRSASSGRSAPGVWHRSSSL